jgi:hypothetical protein
MGNEARDGDLMVNGANDIGSARRQGDRFGGLAVSVTLPTLAVDGMGWDRMGGM